jgi:hypothetical protein
MEWLLNPKLHHTCLPGIRPTHILSLPKTLLNNSLKILLCKGPRALTHYCMCVHVGWLKTARVYLLKHKKVKLLTEKKTMGELTETPDHAWPRVRPNT